MYDRSKTVGASDAVHIQAGDWAELYDRKISQDSPSYGLAAELGHRLEPFNLELFERDTGREVHVDDNWGSDPLRLAEHPWCTYLPDGLLQQDTDDHMTIDDDEFFIPIEAKCINMMWKHENLLAKYMPQLQHAMRVTRSPYCIFSVLYLNTKYEWTKVEYDPPYDDALFEKEKTFQFMLERGIRPPEYKGKRAGWV
jgi:predicted phage-related endonuclease